MRKLSITFFFKLNLIFTLLMMLFVFSCKKTNNSIGDNKEILLNLPTQPYNYSNQILPNHIQTVFKLADKYDNTPFDNPITDDGATLGRVLFYDKALSINDQISCGSCHIQELGFSDGKKLSRGHNGEFTTRNSMSLINLRYTADPRLFWDVRSNTLEEQVLLPIQDMIEMGFPNLDSLVRKLEKIPYYPPLFKNAFGNSEVTKDKIAKSLAQFVRSIVSFNSKYDIAVSRNDFSNFSESELLGYDAFRDQCGTCHGGVPEGSQGTVPDNLMTWLDISISSYGIKPKVIANNGLEIEYIDNGVGRLSQNIKEDGFFKIPNLRNISLTKPYMHDGRFSSLEDVLNHYSNNIQNHKNLSSPLKSPRIVSPTFNRDIIAFLKTLTDYELIKDPKYSNPFIK